MKKTLKTRLSKSFILILILFQTNKINSSSQSHISRLVGHWALSAGPWFADAIHYVALFSEEYASKVFGDEEADFTTETFVHHVLHECGVNSNKIKVKLIKPEARDFVLSAIVCTDSTIFINPTIYNFLTKNEQRALIAQASVMMQKNHLGMNATVLAMIPIATHFLTEGLRSLLKQQFKDSQLIKDNVIAKKIYDGARYGLGFWATKLAVNSMLASLYFKYQSKRYNTLTAKKIGSAESLISYQTKLAEFINEKQRLSLKQIQL